MHTAYRGRQVLKAEVLAALLETGCRWATYAVPGATSPGSQDDITDLDGPFLGLAQLLWKTNGFRPGPVTGWFIVVCLEREARWAVGQLCADPDAPVQLFDDLVFDSEAAARARAQELRDASGRVRR